MTNLENTFNSINKKFIKLKEEEKKTYFKHFENVFGKVISEAKEKDVLFNALYQKHQMSGSYYDNLKISKPNEFDVNILFKLPFNLNDMVFEYSRNNPGFTKVNVGEWIKKLVKSPDFTVKYKRLYDQFMENYLDQQKFRQWFESCISLAYNSITKNNYLTLDTPKKTTYKITLKKSGPAMTMVISVKNCEEFSVDLVPVYRFNLPMWLNGIKNYPNTEDDIRLQKNINWYIVPKPIIDDRKDKYLFWRLSFPEQENYIIHEKQNLKPLIRFLKKTRDHLDFYDIKSYFIKTFVLNQIDKYRNEKDYWRKSISLLFLETIKEFAEVLQKQKINFYWDPKLNLLPKKSITYQNYYNRLKKLIEKYERTQNPDHLFEIFLSKKELEDINTTKI